MEANQLGVRALQIVRNTLPVTIWTHIIRQAAPGNLSVLLIGLCIVSESWDLVCIEAYQDLEIFTSPS